MYTYVQIRRSKMPDAQPESFVAREDTIDKKRAYKEALDEQVDLKLYIYI